MAGKRKRRSTLRERVDENILMDMVDVDTLQGLLEAFGQVCDMGAGIFTPAGTRIGQTAHHSPFCSWLYATKEGRAACLRCDKKVIIDILKKRKVTAPKPYPCHAGLIDFCHPIFSRVAGKRKLIGVFFAGQVLYEEDEITKASVSNLRRLAHRCKVDGQELLARYMQVPRLPRKRVDEIRGWMKHFANLIGLLVEKKAATQQLLLDVIYSADDQDAIVRTVQQHLEPASVSVFLTREHAPPEFADRVFLVATTSKELATQLTVEENLDKISYKPGEGLTGWVYKTGKVLHAPDIRDKDCYPQYLYPPEWKHKVQEIPAWKQPQAFLGAPIRSDDGEVVGVIRAVRLKRNRGPKVGFKYDEIELLTGIASLVGAAITKAQLYKKHAEKVEALNQAQGLLNTLTEPDTNLETITNSMVEQLGKTYVKNGRWKGVYVLQHLRSSGRFRFVAAFPSDLPERRRGRAFADKEGVAGYVLKTKKTFASKNCEKDRVKPTTPWVSVICAPIFHAGEMWGAVSLCCNRELSQTDVDLASPKITQFADNMSLVCRLSEILDAKNAATLVALSLHFEAHEVYKSLKGSQITVDNLFGLISGEEREIMQDLAKEIDKSLIWADVCSELGRYIELCQIEPDTAIETFRKKHIPGKKEENADDDLGHPWEDVSITEVAKRALSSVQGLMSTLKTDMKTHIMDAGIIVGDENLLYIAFRNLLDNAIVKGSKIPDKAGNFRKGLKVFFSVRRDNRTGMTEIVIRDKGVGMNPKILAASRDIYADPTLLRSTSHALGFGTRIVAFIISVHLGSVSLTSELNKGTQVYIRIPSYKKIRRK